MIALNVLKLGESIKRRIKKCKGILMLLPGVTVNAD